MRAIPAFRDRRSRACCAGSGGDEFLFGPVRITGPADARSGLAILRTECLSAASRVSCPHPDRPHGVGTLGDAGLFVETRTAIEAASGTAADARLFSQVMVTPGTRFRLRVAVSVDHAGLADAVAALLAHLAAPAGLGFGRGTGLGQGRLRLLAETVTVACHGPRAMSAPAVHVWWRGRFVAASGGNGAGARALLLSSDVPFLISDSARQPDRQGPEPALAPLLDAAGGARASPVPR